MDDLLQEFIAETRETLDALAGEIVAWEADPADRARLDAIFRFVHTVKGSCGFLDLPRLARLSHAAEDVLAAVRSGQRVPDRALVNAVLAVVDRIAGLVEAIDSGSAVDDKGEELLIAALAEGSDEVAKAAQAPAQRAPPRSVRLNVDLLDRMMSGMSDMVLARNELARRLREADADPALEAALERLSATVADMRDTVTRTRMQRIDALFSALPRLVRDTAASLGKSVTLHIEGADVELDREMIEVMRDPLVHIIRNAIDHGIECPATRRTLGKRENGRLVVAARQSGNQIVLEVTDDGAGIDIDRLIAKLVQSGGDRHALLALGTREQEELIFAPGLSTADQVNQVSGRGVGMDIVRAAIEQIGGRIELDNTPGRGLRIAIHVPLTLSIIATLIVGVADQRFAIPRQTIEEIVPEQGEAIRIDHIGTAPIATVRQRRMPLVDLAATLQLDPAPGRLGRMLAIVGVGGGSYALLVDRVFDSEELVIKPVAPAVMASGLFAGQTLPDSGRPMLMLDCAGIAADAGLRFIHHTVEPEVEEEVAEPGTPALLFRDIDDQLRAVPLAIVDRVETIDIATVSRAGGALHLTVEGRVLALVACAPIDDRRPFGAIRLTDGCDEIAYAMREALDIVNLPEERLPARRAGPVAGIALVADDLVEVLDPHWLFAHHGTGPGAAEPPVCLVDGEDPWLNQFVAPLLEGAGYRVVNQLARDERAATVIGFDTGDIRLRKSAAAQGDDSIYRYDRDAILDAVARRVAGGRR